MCIYNRLKIFNNYCKQHKFMKVLFDFVWKEIRIYRIMFLLIVRYDNSTHSNNSSISNITSFKLDVLFLTLETEDFH